MRYLTADYIFPISSEPIKNGMISVNDKGVITSVRKYVLPSRKAKVEYHKGIICPGFINAHCHLELSHLKNKISEQAGMAGFIKQILSNRNKFSDKEINKAILKGEAEMMKNGIVAVGDISNNNNTFKQKTKGNLRYHTFIETFNLNPKEASQTLINMHDLGSDYLKEFAKAGYPAIKNNIPVSVSFAPHASYSLSADLLLKINYTLSRFQFITSIHNQESEAESELFISKTGKIFDAFKDLGINTDFIRQTGENSLRSTLPFLLGAKKILLVHNTYTTEEDLQFIKSKIKKQKPQIYFCTCPNANMYIENKLPDYNLFIKEKLKMTIGTDSLASNWSLSILDEMKTIAKHFPEISLQTLLTWATKNGAAFFDFDKLGTIEKGKKPGLNLLENLDELKITKNTKVRKLI